MKKEEFQDLEIGDLIFHEKMAFGEYAYFVLESHEDEGYVTAIQLPFSKVVIKNRAAWKILMKANQHIPIVTIEDLKKIPIKK